MTTRPRRAAACIALALVVTACGGDDDAEGSAPTTAPAGEATTTTAASSEPTQPPMAIATSVEQWFADWNEINVTAATENDAAGITIDPGAFAYGPGPDGTEAFAGRISPSVTMGGLRDPDSGYVTALFQGADPDGATTAAASLTTLTHLGDLDDPQPLLNAYREVALDPRSGNQRYVAAGDYDFVIRGMDGADAGDGLVLIFVHSTTDEATAVARADEVQEVVFDLLQQAES